MKPFKLIVDNSRVSLHVHVRGFVIMVLFNVLFMTIGASGFSEEGGGYSVRAAQEKHRKPCI